MKFPPIAEYKVINIGYYVHVKYKLLSIVYNKLKAIKIKYRETFIVGISFPCVVQ